MSEIAVQIIVILSFVGIVTVLFFDKRDYLTYSVLFMLVASLASALVYTEAQHLEFYIDAIEWEIIFFFIPMFIIVEILQPVFKEMARRIVAKNLGSQRRLFYAICVSSTLIASIIEDLSVAILFIPIVIRICQKIEINPVPYMLGITICINLASTLTPFGSAENLLIYNHFELSTVWFLTNFSLYFIVGTIITLILLDKFVLTKSIIATQHQLWDKYHNQDSTNETPELELPCLEPPCAPVPDSYPFATLTIIELNLDAIPEEDRMNPSHYNKNLIGLGIFFGMLLLIREVYLVGLIGLLIFAFLNPRQVEEERKRADLAYFALKADYKLVYFFMCLFILSQLMSINGTTTALGEWIAATAHDNVFILCIELMLIVSVLSGLMDDAPVTVIFLPIMDILLAANPGFEAPLLIAFILGINLGGNFLPQGAACDMMTLQLAQQFGLEELSYKKLVKVGSAFAFLHVTLGIIYIGLYIEFFL